MDQPATEKPVFTIPRGVAMALKGVLNMLGVDGDKIINSVDGFSQIMAGIYNELIIIRSNQRAIMQHLGIEHDAGTAKTAEDKPAQFSNGGTGETSGPVTKTN